MSNKDTRTEHDVVVQSEVNGVVTSDTVDMLFDNVDVKLELGYLSADMIGPNFSGRTLAGTKVVYKFNSYGSLNIKLDKYKLKGKTKSVVLAELFQNYFRLDDVEDMPHQWAIYQGVLFADTAKPILGKFLLRGNKVIGFYKPKAKVTRTIKFYEKKVYSSLAKNIHHTHKPVDYKLHVVHEVYDTQTPEFTRESELEEIRSFVASLKRRLSPEEQDIINDIASEFDRLRTI